MTLKELRISKGLNQSECAKFLGMSVRNYQNYENNSDKINTAKYHAIYSKLNSYGTNVLSEVPKDTTMDFNTAVVIGEELQRLVNRVLDFEKRDCYSILRKFVEGNYDGKVCILYGLRRTGKTTLLLQMISNLPVEKTAYIKVQTTDNMSALTKDLRLLFKNGYRYVFIDEITLLDDFINTAAVLSDIYSMMGMKIVISGTDSLGFAMANRDELYDRSVTIHTSFIPFREYVRVLNIRSVDRYIEYGGTLKMENMSLDDPDAAFDDVSFRNDESTRKYIDTAISRNIQHTLENDHHGEYFNQLRDLYSANELTNLINRIIQNFHHRFVLRVVEEKFKSHDFGSARELLLHDPDETRANILYEVNEQEIIDRLKEIIEVREKAETKVEVKQEHVDKVKKYLLMLDLIVCCYERYESGGYAERMVFSQPGMRYAIAKALVYSLRQDEHFGSVSEADKDHVINKILDDVKGRMLEDIVLLETQKTASDEEEVFQFKFDQGGEYDMVIYDRKSHSCKIYEIKHSREIVVQQTIHLRNSTKCAIVENRFGRIAGKFVLYRGKNATVDDISYLNVEQYLCELA